jgi:hypothetical protein
MARAKGTIELRGDARHTVSVLHLPQYDLPGCKYGSRLYRNATASSVPRYVWPGPEKIRRSGVDLGCCLGVTRLRPDRRSRRHGAGAVIGRYPTPPMPIGRSARLPKSEHVRKPTEENT